MATLTLIEVLGTLKIARAEWVDENGRTHRAEFDVSTEIVDGNGVTCRRRFSTAATAEAAAALAIAAANDRAEAAAAAQAPSLCYRDASGRVAVAPQPAAAGMCPLAYGPRAAMELAAEVYNR